VATWILFNREEKSESQWAYSVSSQLHIQIQTTNWQTDSFSKTESKFCLLFFILLKWILDNICSIVMSTSAATASTTDSNLSGQPSDNIDQQKGPSQGSNAESPGSTLGTATTTVQPPQPTNNAGDTSSQ